MITEKDDSPGRFIVVYVAKIVNDNKECYMELCDGWYTLKTTIDEPMKELIRTGRITLGQKLSIYGAKVTHDYILLMSQIIGLNEPCPPLEVSGAVSLQISTNSTRRARSETKLGYQKNCIFSVSMKSLVNGLSGGIAPCIDVIVMRRYSVEFMETNANGRIFRSVQEEEIADREYQVKYGKLYDALQSRFQKQVTATNSDSFHGIDDE